jgi:hypothetical protein
VQKSEKGFQEDIRDVSYYIARPASRVQKMDLELEAGWGVY